MLTGQLLGTYADGDYTDYYYLGREMVARYSDSTQSDAPGYTGHVEDDDLGLVYMQQRYYDANIGRFYSNDPVSYRDVHSFNRYAYANNNPYKYIDPTGMVSEKVIDKTVSLAKKSPQTQLAASSIAIGSSIAIQASSEQQDPSKIMGTVIKTNPVTGGLTMIPGVGELLEKGLDDLLNPVDSDDLTDEQLQQGNFDGRIRVKDMDRFIERSSQRQSDEKQETELESSQETKQEIKQEYKI